MKSIIIAAIMAASAPALAMDIYTCDFISADMMQGEAVPGTVKFAKQAAIVAATKSQFMSTINKASIKSPEMDYRGFGKAGEVTYLMKDGQFSYGTSDFFVVLNNCMKVK